MKKINFMLGEIIWQHKRAPLLTMTVYFSTVICFISIFLSLSVLQQNEAKYKSIAQAKKTYSDILIQNDIEGENAVLSLATLIEDYNAKIDGCNVSIELSEQEVTIEGIDYPMPLTVCPLSADGEISSYKYKVLEGRDFTSEEIKQGANLIIADKSVIIDGEKLKLGDNLKIADTEFEVIGIANAYAVPFKSLISALSESNLKYRISINKAVFDSELSAQERSQIASFIDTDFISDFELGEEQNSDIRSTQIIVAVFISALGCVITVSLMTQIISEQLRRIMLAKICGCKASYIVCLLMTELFFFILISFAASVAFFTALKPLLYKLYITNPVTLSKQLSVLFALLFLSAAFTLPMTLRAARALSSRIFVRR